MQNSTLITLITVGGGIVVAVIGNAKGWFKRSIDTPGTNAQVAANTGDISGSMVAVGENITQNSGTIHQHYTAASPSGPFDRVASRPSIVEIANAILDASTPFERTQVPARYVGLDVSWPAHFASVDPRYGGGWTVTFDSNDEHYRSVSVKIDDIGGYPKLKVIKHGHPAWIKGTIRSADVRTIDLEDDAEFTLE
jgi:hypothetical protein